MVCSCFLNWSLLVKDDTLSLGQGLSVFVIPGSQGHGLFVGNVEKVTEEGPSSVSVPPSENIWKLTK